MPTAYGGVLQYNHVDIGGGGLPLGVMGLRGYTEITSDMMGMAPPYQAVFGLTYLFDRPLRGANNLSLVLPHPPNNPGSCYTQIEPEGFFDGSFNTVDVGDYIDLRPRRGRLPRGAHEPHPTRLPARGQPPVDLLPGAREPQPGVAHSPGAR